MHIHHIRYKIASIVVILLIRILVLMFSMPIERKYERVSILFNSCYLFCGAVTRSLKELKRVNSFSLWAIITSITNTIEYV